MAGVALPVAEQDIGDPDRFHAGVHGLMRVMPGYDGPQGGGVREKAPFGVSVYLQQVLEIPAFDGGLFLEGECTAGLVDEGDGAELGGNLVDDVVVLIFAAGVVGVGLQAGIFGEVKDGDVFRPGESLFGELDDFAVHGVFQKCPFLVCEILLVLVVACDISPTVVRALRRTCGRTSIRDGLQRRNAGGGPSGLRSRDRR